MKLASGLMLTIIVVGCAHHRDVRPSSDGNHKVVLNTEDKTSGYSMAKRQADHYCEEGGKHAFVGTENYKYIGSVDEDTYNAGKTASKIATGVGSAGMVFGGKKEKNAGGIVGLGGQVANSALGQGYSYTMQFSCK